MNWSFFLWEMLWAFGLSVGSIPYVLYLYRKGKLQDRFTITTTLNIICFLVLMYIGGVFIQIRWFGEDPHTGFTALVWAFLSGSVLNLVFIKLWYRGLKTAIAYFINIPLIAFSICLLLGGAISLFLAEATFHALSYWGQPDRTMFGCSLHLSGQLGVLIICLFVTLKVFLPSLIGWAKETVKYHRLSVESRQSVLH